MVSCDVCEEWYHMGCVRLSAAAARSMRKYTCPVCASFKVGNVLHTPKTAWRLQRRVETSPDVAGLIV